MGVFQKQTQMSHYSPISKYGYATLFALLPFMVQAQLNVTIQQDRQPTCFGYTDGQVSAVVTGGATPYTFAWSSGTNTPNSTILSGIGAGDYKVTVTDKGGVSAIKTFTVTQPPVLRSAPASVSGAVCATINENYAANTTGGVAPYTYRWYDVANATVGTAATQLMANAGQYYVAVTDAARCTSTQPMVVNAPMTAKFDKNDISCGGMCDGSAMAVVTGGKTPYTYLWNFTPANPPNNTTNRTSVLFPVPGGTYACTITDAAGCTRTISGAVFEPTPLGLNLTVTAGGICQGGASVQGVATGGYPGTKNYVLMAPDNTVFGANTTGIFANLGIGEYHLVVKDPHGCAKDSCFSIRDMSTLTVSATQTPATCTGATNGTATAKIVGGNGPWKYIWSNGATTAQATNLGAGTYTVSVYDGMTCFKTASVTVGATNTLTINAKVTNTSCKSSDGRIDITATSTSTNIQYTLSGTPAVTNTTGQFANLATGNYTVTVVDGNGCRATTAATVSNGNGSSTLTCGATTSAATCTSATGGFTLTPAGGKTPYTYTMNGANYNSPIFTGLAAGDYTILMTDANGCQVTSVVTVPRNSVVVNLNATANAADCTNATGGVTALANGGTAPYRYTLNGTTNTTGIFTNLSAGNFTVSVADANGCQNSVATQVTTNGANITATAIASSTFCGSTNGSLTFNATGGTAPYNYTLNGVTNTTGTFTNLSANSYTVTIKDATGCQSSRSAVISNHNSAITATATVTAAACSGTTGSVKVVSTGGTAPYTYTLNGVSNTTGLFTGLSAAAYTVTVKDANTCSGTVSATVTGTNGNITAKTTATPAICTNNTGSLTVVASGGNLPYTYATNGASNTTGLFERLAAGNYVVTITDANNCQTTQSQSVTATNSAITPTVNAANTTCAGNDGQITVAATGGTNSYRFELPNSNNTNGQFTGLAVGNYVVTVSDGNGCKATTNATVANGAKVVTSTASTTAAICTNNNGVIVVTGAGGTAPYTYTLSGASNQTGRFENLAGNTYDVTIVDAGNCRTTANVTLPINNMSVSATVKANNATCRGNDGALTVVATGGNGAFWYAVNGKSNITGVFTGLASGNYTIISTDGNGCQARSTGSIQDGSSLLAPTVEATTASICTSNNGTAQLKVTGGTGNYSYALNGATNATGQFTGLASGNYTATITDGATCRTTVPVTIGATTSKVVLTPDRVGATSCTGKDGSILVSASGGTNPYTYRLNTTSNSTGQFNGLTPNTYTVTATDANGCANTVSATVNAATGLLATTSNLKVPTCRNANGGFRVVPTNGTAPYTYRLGSESNETGTFANLATGNYVVTVTDANNCATTLPSVNLQSVGTITAAITTTPVRCMGDSVIIRFTDASTVSGGTQLSRKWLFGTGLTGTDNNLELTIATRTADVRLIVNSAQGCSDTISQSLPVGLLEVAVQDTATNCQNTTVNVAATNNSLGAPVSYTWTPNHLIVSGGNTSNPKLAVGTTRQMVYVSITNGVCTKTDSVVINPILPSPVNEALVTNNAACANGLQVDFSNTNTNAGAYRWVFGDPANPTAGASSANTSYTYGAAGTYTALLIPAGACLDTVRRTFSVQNGAAVQLRTIPNYQTGVNYCDASITVQLRARTNATTVRWSTDRNFARIIGADTLANVVPANGSTTFYVEGKDARGCRTVDSTKLTDRSIGVDLQDTLGICADGAGKLVATNQNSRDTLSITWTPPAGVTLLKGQGELRPDFSGTGTGYIYGFFRNQWGCTKLDSAQVSMIHLTASLTAKDSVVAKGDSTILTLTPSGSGNYTYTWNPAVTTTNAPVSVKPDTTTTYYVIVTDANGCKAMAKAHVKIYSPECRDPYIYIPNAFSPNGDANNEMLYVRGENLKQQCYFAVYNRWGEIVFESYNKEDGWNGVHKGTPVCPDVYGYYLRGTCKNGEPIFIKGNVTVLK
jgi:gliding motility-associated-like protein